MLVYVEREGVVPIMGKGCLEGSMYSTTNLTSSGYRAVEEEVPYSSL